MSTSHPKLFIGISGVIGAGKTTLATALAAKLHLPVYYEPVTENAYLQDFYTDMKKYSFPLQIYLLQKRFEQHQRIVWGEGGVQDRTIYEDSVFARMLCNDGLLEARDLDTYNNLFSCMANFMKKPSVIIHLDVSPEESLRRVRLRQRACEASITLEYLQKLHQAYEEFLTNISQTVPVLRVDWEQFHSADDVANLLERELHEMRNIKTVRVASS